MLLELSRFSGTEKVGQTWLGQVYAAAFSYLVKAPRSAFCCFSCPVTGAACEGHLHSGLGDESSCMSGDLSPFWLWPVGALTMLAVAMAYTNSSRDFYLNPVSTPYVHRETEQENSGGENTRLRSDPLTSSVDPPLLL